MNLELICGLVIKEDNLGNSNKLYLILHEVGSLHSQGSRELWSREESNNFYRENNKEQARKKMKSK